MLRDAWPLLLSGAAVALYTRIDQVVIMNLQGAEANGMYAAATRLSEIFYVVPTILATSLFPRFQRLRNESKEQYVLAMANLMMGVTALCTIISLVVFLFAAGHRDFYLDFPALIIH